MTDRRDDTPVFLVESPHPWWGVWQRPHHIMSRLAKWFPVSYVTRVYGRDLRTQRKGFQKWRSTTDPAHGDIQLRAVKQWHGERFNFILRRNQRSMTRAFEECIANQPQRPRVLWIYDPHKGFLADKIEHDILVYDIMDEYSEFPFAPPRIAEEERMLIQRADQVFAGTWALFERKKADAKNIKCYCSKVDVNHFSKAQSDNCSRPPEFQIWDEIYDYLIGYFGMVDGRIDWSMVKEAAASQPDWGFIFVGPVRDVPEDIASIPNIELIGQRSYEQLPSYCKVWDICWIPFVRNEWTDHINPTKMLEYFAAGRPALSVRIPDVVKCYSDEAFLGDTADDFLAIIDDYRAAPEKHKARLDLAAETAKKNSWDQLVLDMLGDLDITLPTDKK